jgi:nitrogen fixation/metabolism regulation signal transduction histidine kinase
MNRFEAKIAVALVLAAAVPLSIALAFAARLVDESVDVGLNERVRRAVEGKAPIMRDYIRARVAYFRATLHTIAEAGELSEVIAKKDPHGIEAYLRAALKKCEHCAELTLEVAGTSSAQSTTLRVTSPREYKASDWVVRSFPAEAEPGHRVPRHEGARLRLRAALERRYQEGLQEAGEFARLFALLAEKNAALKNAYLLAFAVILGAALLIALAIGLFLARRVTKRISVLIDATKRVATGDLAFAIPVRSRDEITDLTQAFNKMLADLSESQRRIVYLETIAAWQEIARRLAHEIKNPLTPILLAMQQVHKKYPGGDAAFARTLDQALEVVTEEVGSLRTLVTEFSDFAKLPSVHLAPFELGAFVDEVARAEEAEGQAITLRRPDGDIPVRIDRMLLRRAFTNLLKNAREAMRSAGVDAAPELEVRVLARSVVLDVLDRGPGVPREAKARIFDPYFTTKHDGTGLGLSIVKKILLDHGGTIKILDRPGGGALFRVTLPLCAPEKAASAPEPR